MKFDLCCLYAYRSFSEGITVFQPHVGWCRTLGFTAYLVVLNILIFDLIIELKPCKTKTT